MSNTSLGYSLSQVAGFSPRAEIGKQPLMYEQSLVSYPVIRDNKYNSPLLKTNQEYYSKFGKRSGSTSTIRISEKEVNRMIRVLTKM